MEKAKNDMIFDGLRDVGQKLINALKQKDEETKVLYYTAYCILHKLCLYYFGASGRFRQDPGCANGPAQGNNLKNTRCASTINFLVLNFFKCTLNDTMSASFVRHRHALQTGFCCWFRLGFFPIACVNLHGGLKYVELKAQGPVGQAAINVEKRRNKGEEFQQCRLH